MRISKATAIIFSVLMSHSPFAQGQERFSSEGSCSCKISWDCLSRIDKCSERTRIKKRFPYALRESAQSSKANLNMRTSKRCQGEFVIPRALNSSADGNISALFA